MVTRTQITAALLVVTVVALTVMVPYQFSWPDPPTMTVAPIADVRSKPSDPLAGSAPFLKDLRKQMDAGKKLEGRLLKAHAQFRCQNSQLIKNQGEGSRHYCRDKGFEVKAPCLIYSFGINYDFTFDDFFGNMGCDVFSFDPSMDTPDHRRSSQVMFYQVGLGAADNDSFEPRLDGYVKQKTTWKVRTQKTLMAMLNHTHITIDVLKMDIECWEWTSVRNMLDSGVLRQVKQVLVEWHIFRDCPARERFQQLIAVLDDLHRAGFRSFDIMPHWPPPKSWKTYNVQSDFGYVNTRFHKQ